MFDPPVRGKSAGLLSNLLFATKDLFDVQGHRTGCGNPDWERTHSPATRTAPAIRDLLDAGATLVGKTHTDELAYSLNGENFHFGTPVNPRAAGRVPGGSSSGSAAAVAGGAVDFSIGTDTAASVRLPASYCGIYGIRPTHGRLSRKGFVPLAPSFDTVGWFAPRPELLRDIGRVLLKAEAAVPKPAEFIVAEAAFVLCDQPVRDRLEHIIEKIAPRWSVRKASLQIELSRWPETLRTLQAFEAWRAHGEWITRNNPHFGPGIRERFAWASSVTHEQYLDARRTRKKIKDTLARALASRGVLLWPTSPCIALPPRLSPEDLEPRRQSILSLTCVAPLGGLPQVTLPVGLIDSCPIGLSLIAAAGRDMDLLEYAIALSAWLGDENP